jgi:hypothetical protein
MPTMLMLYYLLVIANAQALCHLSILCTDHCLSTP